MESLAHVIVKKRRIIYIIMGIIVLISALLIPRVDINYALADYLDEDSETSIALDMMEQEYGENGVLYLLIKDIEASDAEAYISDIEAIDDIDSVGFDRDESHHYSDFNARYTLNLTNTNYDEANVDIINTLIDTFDEDYNIYFDGPAFQNIEVENMIDREMPLIVVLAVIISLLILTLSARSYIEPFIFIGVVSVAIVMNMGTNLLFGEISYITRSVAAVLQLGLSMDYSIMLLNRYHETLKDEKNHEPAMIKALSQSFRPISASSLTTVAGMMALMVMSYGIGFDIGSVLAKGILLSLLSVFVLMPGLLVSFSSLYERFKKKALRPKPKMFYGLAFKTRKIMPVLLIVIVGLSFVMQSQNTFSFTDDIEIESSEEVRAFFPQTNQVLLIYDKHDDYLTSESSIIERFEAIEYNGNQPHLDTTALSSSAYQQFTKSEATDGFDLDPLIIETLFGLYALENTDIDHSVMGVSMIEHLYAFRNDAFLESYADDEMIALIEEAHQFKDHLQNSYTYVEAADILSTEENEMLALYYAYENEDFDFDASQAAQTIEITAAIALGQFDPDAPRDFDALIHFIDERNEAGDIDLGEEESQQIELLITLNDLLDEAIDETLMQSVFDIEEADGKLLMAHYHSVNHLDEDFEVTAIDFLSIIDDFLAEDSQIAASIDEESITMFEALYDDLKDAEGSLEGQTTHRMFFLFDLPTEGSDTAHAIEQMRSDVDSVFEGDAYLAGDIISTYDIEQSFYNDYILISLITVLAIFTLVLMAFKNILIPLILVLVIQGAIWFSMSFNVFMDSSLFFLSYLMIIAIQMGATVDYGILLTSNYTESRENHNKFTAMYQAIDQSLPTIFTSGFILMTAGLSVGLISSINSIEEVGFLLLRGTLISIIFVTIILPALLLVLDKAILKSYFYKK